MKKKTIKDLAEASGFSASTISRVLANKGNVKEETRLEIERLLVANNYRSGSVSTRISKAVQKMILAVVHDPSNEFHLNTIKKIQSECITAGYFLLVAISDGIADLEEKYVMLAQGSSLAGIVLMTPSETDTLKNLIAGSETPVVLVNRYLPSLDLDVVCIDNYRGGYLATTHLLENGCQRVCHVAGPQDSSASRDRLRGFQDALRDAGVPASDEDIYYGTLLRASGREFAKHYLDNRLQYDGIFFANDMAAAGFVNFARARDVRIPEDVSVVCFDNSPAVTEGPIPLTTVSIDGEFLGEEAAKILLARIAGSDAPPTKHIYPPVLQERQSVRKSSPVR